MQEVLRGTPGLNIGYDASAKGGGSMQVRGQRSVYTDGGHNDPLIILDGMMFYGELSEINPDDIAQIDVLKDASSAAVYGAITQDQWAAYSNNQEGESLMSIFGRQ